MKKYLSILVGIIVCGLFFIPLAYPLPTNTENKTIPEPQTVFVYTKEFAQRFGLDESKAINLDPGILAIVLMFKKHYLFSYLPESPFVKAHHLDQLTQDQGEVVNKHLEVFPILFAGEKMPLEMYYDCYLGFYLDNNNPQIKNLQYPVTRDQQYWNDKQYSDFAYEVLHPIDEKQINPVQDPTLKNTYLKVKDNTLSLSGLYLTASNSISPTLVFTKNDKDLTSGSNDNYYAFSFRSYEINFLPDVTYLSIGPAMCNGLTDEASSNGALLWLEKSGGRQYYDNGSGGIKFKRDDFYRFKIPTEIINSLEIKRVANYILNENATARQQIFPNLF